MCLCYIVCLAGGRAPSEGRIELFHEGQWGTVCDDYFDLTDGGVVCRQLGHRDAMRYYHNARFGQGSGPIWLDDLQCTGTEVSLFNCSHRGIGIHNCRHYHDAGVQCKGMV